MKWMFLTDSKVLADLGTAKSKLDSSSNGKKKVFMKVLLEGVWFVRWGRLLPGDGGPGLQPHTPW